MCAPEADGTSNVTMPFGLSSRRAADVAAPTSTSDVTLATPDAHLRNTQVVLSTIGSQTDIFAPPQALVFVAVVHLACDGAGLTAQE